MQQFTENSSGKPNSPISRRVFSFGVAGVISGLLSPCEGANTIPQKITIPQKMPLDLRNIPLGEGSIMVSEMTKSGMSWNSKVIGKNFDNLHDTGGIASLTKIMTALVVYELCKEKNIDPKKYKISVKSEHRPSITPGSITTPSQWTIDQALAALLMKSHNTLANALASGIIPQNQFLDRMNATARRIGMKNTTYITPSGISTGNSSNQSTEIDLQKLVEYTLESQYPLWSHTKKVAEKFPQSQIPTGRLESADKIFLNIIAQKYRNWEIIGTKTGFMKDSGKCVITLVKHRLSSRIFSIIGLNMTKKGGGQGDIERRTIRLGIIRRLEKMIE